MSKPQDNPYLAHLPPSQRGVSTTSDPTAKEPLYGFIPRKVTGNQVRKVMVRERFLNRELNHTTELDCFYRMVMSTHSRNNLIRDNTKRS